MRLSSTMKVRSILFGMGSVFMLLIYSLLV